ncbi:hypothetical protein BV006_00562B, partial [Haemophilus influenzae]
KRRKRRRKPTNKTLESFRTFDRGKRFRNPAKTAGRKSARRTISKAFKCAA